MSSAKEKQILIVGGTGDLGGSVAHYLLTNGFKVRALVRSMSKYQSLSNDGAELAFGDLKDPKSLEQASVGAKIVITTANSARRGGADNPQTVDLDGNRNLIDAASKAGVGQFIFVSMDKADPNSPNPFVKAKGITEEYLRKGKMPYTIIAPNAFMEFWISQVIGIPAVSGKPVTIVGEGVRKHSFVSAADVAKFMVASIDNPNAINKRLVIGGPQALSLRDSTAIFSRLLKKDIPINSVEMGQPINGMPDMLVGMLASLNFFDSAIDMTKLTETFQIKLTKMEDFVDQFIKNTNS